MFEIVLDVPKNAVNVAFGFKLYGKGVVWADDFNLEEVSISTPLTRGKKRIKKFKTNFSASSEESSEDDI